MKEKRFSLSSLILNSQAIFNPSLFSLDATARLISFASTLPTVSPLLFEVRLHNHSSAIDLSFPLPEDLRDYCPGITSSSMWEKILAFHEETLDGGLFHKIIGGDVFWCEFDSDQMLRSPPLPCIFVDIIPEHKQTSDKSPSLAMWISNVFSRLTSSVNSDHVLVVLERIIATLPLTVRISHLGVMLSRGKSDLRINLSGWKDKDLISWLSLHGFNDVADRLNEIMRTSPTVLVNPILTIDVAKQIHSRIGIECHPPTRKTNSDVNRWAREILHWLDTQYYIQASQADAILEWTGYKKKRLHYILTPPVKDKDGARFIETATDLSHIKLVFDSEKPIEVKAYLLLNYIAETEGPHFQGTKFYD